MRAGTDISEPLRSNLIGPCILATGSWFSSDYCRAGDKNKSFSPPLKKAGTSERRTHERPGEEARGPVREHAHTERQCVGLNTQCLRLVCGGEVCINSAASVPIQCCVAHSVSRFQAARARRSSEVAEVDAIASGLGSSGSF
ncbi:hypothetical protein PoB_007645000 [Plakobranchus ocellatus]|uniref:Uncharacterized protein n=1 Tax=Plakobranchus ocellatus TaxID=259542 RepID=A0AAV4E0M8_9GAST|nr:hypothetical protein PoB_007645000 [Plakobranchus ocellatus]